MVKNYNPAWIIFAVLLITFNFSYSQSNHTVTFTGFPNDFTEAEKIKGNTNYDYNVTFDDNYMYFGAFRTNGTEFNDNDHFTIYIDTDPQPQLNSGFGSTSGVSVNGQTPILPFNADHRFVLKKGNSEELSHHKHNGTTWVNQSVGVISKHTSSISRQIAIAKSELSGAKGIYFSMFITHNNGKVNGFGDHNYPIKFTGLVSTGYFGGIGINAKGIAPTKFKNTPILHTLTNANPVAGGKYAHIDINNGYYTAPGNIEIVAGGTATIAAGSALTINGTFTNNGLVTLQSTSTSYSSLIPTAVAGTGIIKYNRHVNRNGNDLISAPLTGQTFLEFATDNPNLYENAAKTTQKRFGPFNKTIGEYRNYDLDISGEANAVLSPGIGYRAASNIVTPSTSGGPLTFTGFVETGDVNIGIFDTNNKHAKWNLIGNPYPSYLKVTEFLDINSTEFDSDLFAIYGYKGETGGWQTINKANSDNLLMAPGQGFLVMSKDTNGTIKFTPNLRSAGSSDDFVPLRSALPENKASINLKLSSASKTYTTEIYFNNQGTLSHDIGYDSGLIENPTFSIHTQLVEDIGKRNVPLAIQTLPYSILGSEVIVPIGITAKKGEQLTISIGDTAQNQPLPSNVDVYFEDVKTNTSTSIKNGDYVFTPTTDISEIGRFFLRFSNKTLGVIETNFDDLEIYSPHQTGFIIIKGYVQENTNLEIFDLNGRLLQTATVKPNQSIHRFELSGLSTGIYIVKLKNKTQAKIKKIQVNH